MNVNDECVDEILYIRNKNTNRSPISNKSNPSIIMKLNISSINNMEELFNMLIGISIEWLDGKINVNGKNNGRVISIQLVKSLVRENEHSLHVEYINNDESVIRMKYLKTIQSYISYDLHPLINNAFEPPLLYTPVIRVNDNGNIHLSNILESIKGSLFPPDYINQTNPNDVREMYIRINEIDLFHDEFSILNDNYTTDYSPRYYISHLESI
jgi:hypothetical protein